MRAPNPRQPFRSSDPSGGDRSGGSTRFLPGHRPPNQHRMPRHGGARPLVPGSVPNRPGRTVLVPALAFSHPRDPGRTRQRSLSLRHRDPSRPHAPVDDLEMHTEATLALWRTFRILQVACLRSVGSMAFAQRVASLAPLVAAESRLLRLRTLHLTVESRATGGG